MKYKEFIQHFNIKKQISDTTCMAICPNHNDKEASLSITDDGDKILMHCFAGCDTSNILNSVGLTEKDLFNTLQEKPIVVAEYIYRDEDNSPLYKVIRFQPKNFTQAKYDNGNWVFKMAGAKYVLYNLPEIIKSDVIYFVEGEKDVNNLNSIGLVATTSAGRGSFI